MSETTIGVIGAGGIGGEVTDGLVKKGFREVKVVDPETVRLPDLNRQHFGRSALYKDKSRELCRAASKRGFLGTTLTPYVSRFQDLDLSSFTPDILVGAVDRSWPGTRSEICRHAYVNGIPCVFAAVSTDADAGYVFVQEPDPQRACWACCLKPEMTLETKSEGDCEVAAATTDILKMVAGLALYAVDSVCLERKRDWNYWAISLSRSDYGGGTTVKRRPECPICGDRKGA